MKNLKSVFTLIITSLFIYSTSAQDIPEGYQKVVKKFELALIESNPSALSKLFTSDAITQEMGGQVLHGQSAIEEHYTKTFSQMTYTEPNITVDEVMQIAPNTFFGRGTFVANINIKANGQKMPATSYWSNISIVEDSVMKIKRHMIAIPASR